MTLSVRVYAQSLGAEVGHPRTRDGEREVDLMVTRPDGKTVAIEVKSSPNVANAETKHLHWLRKKLGSDLLDAVVVNTGDTAYRRADSIAVIPAAILGP